MSGNADFLVVGLGAMGSSHGETRITRQAVGEGRDYVPLVVDSHRIWRELEAETGEQLLNACGVLVMAPGTGETSHHGKPDFVARSTDAARAFGITHEVLNGKEVAHRFPQFLGLEGNEKAYHEPGGGYVLPERCIHAQLTRAKQLGAVIRANVEVLSITQTGAGVRVETTAGTYKAGQVVVSAGAWDAHLLGAPFDRLLTVNRQVLHWFELEGTSAYRANAPVFIWMHGATDVDYLYGFPPLPGDRRLKVATEQYETSTTADTIDRVVDPAESAKMYRDHVQGRMAGVTPRVVQAAACLYTVTPDRGFIIDRHPEQDRVFVISACSGHGFKHSAGIGNVVAEKVAEGRSSIDLSPFSVSRFGLNMARTSQTH